MKQRAKNRLVQVASTAVPTLDFTMENRATNLANIMTNHTTNQIAREEIEEILGSCYASDGMGDFGFGEAVEKMTVYVQEAEDSVVLHIKRARGDMERDAELKRWPNKRKSVLNIIDGIIEGLEATLAKERESISNNKGDGI